MSNEKLEASINEHISTPSFDWKQNMLTQPQSGPGSGGEGDGNQHFRQSLDEMRALLVEAKNIANDLLTDEPGKVADARQLKVLKGLVDGAVSGIFWQEQVIDILKAPPASGLSNGDRYLVGVGATGDFTGEDGKIAVYASSDSVWSFLEPQERWGIFVKETYGLYVYLGGEWSFVGDFSEIADILVQTRQARDDVLNDPGFQAVAGDLEGANNIGNVSDHIEDVIQTAAIHEDIGSVAGIAQDVTDIAGIKADVTAVSGIKADVTSVSGIKADVSKVATIDSDVSNVASIKQNVTDVAGIKTDVTDVANIKADVSGVADIKVAVSGVNANKSNINTVAGNNVNVSTVAANIGNVNKVGAIDTNVTKVANIDSDVTKVASIDTAVANVSSIKDNVVAVDGNKANINAVNANKTNIDKVAETKVNIDAVVLNKPNIDVVAADLNLGVASKIKIVAEDKANIDAVAANKTNINAVNANKTNINAVALNKTNIDKVATIDAQITTLAPIKNDIITVAGKKTEVTALGARTTEIDALYAQLPAIAEKESIANVDALKGTGWTGETVKGNADAIGELDGHIAQNESDIGDLRNDKLDKIPETGASVGTVQNPYSEGYFNNLTVDGQNLRKTDNVQFASVNTGFGANKVYKISEETVAFGAVSGTDKAMSISAMDIKEFRMVNTTGTITSNGSKAYYLRLRLPAGGTYFVVGQRDSAIKDLATVSGGVFSGGDIVAYVSNKNTFNVLFNVGLIVRRIS